MNDSELQEYKTIYIKEALGSTDDGIGLVDLIVALDRRWKLMAIILVCSITLGTVYALTQPTQYTYSTTLMTGAQIIDGNILPFPAANNLLAKFQHSYIPMMQRERQSSGKHNIDLTQKIKATAPRGSNIVVLEAQGEKKQSDLFLEALHDLTQVAVQDHKQPFENIKRYIVASRESARAELALLGSQGDRPSEMSILLRNKIELHNAQLGYLKNIEVILPPTQSPEPTSRSEALIIIAAAFAGIALAIFAAFIAELVSKVKRQL